jgi:ribosome-associated translation inhibitor RaiA
METLELGGNIVLTGFSDRDFTELIVVKKMVGQYARKLADTQERFARLEVVLKEIHHTPGSHGKFEIKTRATVDGRDIHGEAVDHNIFVSLDNSLKHVTTQLEKAQ